MSRLDISPLIEQQAPNVEPVSYEDTLCSLLMLMATSLLLRDATLKPIVLNIEDVERRIGDALESLGFIEMSVFTRIDFSEFKRKANRGSSACYEVESNQYHACTEAESVALDWWGAPYESDSIILDAVGGYGLRLLAWLTTKLIEAEGVSGHTFFDEFDFGTLLLAREEP